LAAALRRANQEADALASAVFGLIASCRKLSRGDSPAAAADRDYRIEVFNRAVDRWNEKADPLFGGVLTEG
jgi:hypothetical protein